MSWDVELSGDGFLSSLISEVLEYGLSIAVIITVIILSVVSAFLVALPSVLITFLLLNYVYQVFTGIEALVWFSVKYVLVSTAIEILLVIPLLALVHYMYQLGDIGGKAFLSVITFSVVYVMLPIISLYVTNRFFMPVIPSGKMILVSLLFMAIYLPVSGVISKIIFSTYEKTKAGL